MSDVNNQTPFPKLLPTREALTEAAQENRGVGFVASQASNDTEACGIWLAEALSSPHTFASNHKEVERFLHWLHDRDSSLSSCTSDNLLDYERFLANPPARFISEDGKSWPRQHVNWRPFRGPLAASSIRLAMQTLRSLFSYLVKVGYLRPNVFDAQRAIRTDKAKAGRQRIKTEKHLHQDTWRWFIVWLDRRPRDTPEQVANAERTRWIFHLFYYTALRRAEPLWPTMAHFHQTDGRWWLTVVRKGGSIEDGDRVPVMNELLDALKRYRLYNDLPALPAGEALPLILKLRGTGPLTPKALWKLVKDTFSEAAEATPTEAMRQQLSAASVHWLRHSRATHLLAEGKSMTVVQKLLGHATQDANLYTHIESNNLHDAFNAATTITDCSFSGGQHHDLGN